MKIIDSIKKALDFIAYVIFGSMLTSIVIIAVVVSAVMIWHAIINKMEMPEVQMSWSTKKCVKIVDVRGERTCPDDLNMIGKYRIDWVK